jgi:hypothetical protein
MRPRLRAVHALSRPHLDIRVVDPMPRLERTSSKKRRSSSRAARVPQPPASAPPAPAASPVVHELKANDFWLSSPDIAKPPTREIPELITMMLEAIWAEPKGDRTVKKKFVARFEGRTLSTGFTIKHALAEYMATCCQEAKRHDGGNRYQS